MTTGMTWAEPIARWGLRFGLVSGLIVSGLGCAANGDADGGRRDVGPPVRIDAGPIPGFDAGRGGEDAGPMADGGADGGELDGAVQVDAGTDGGAAMSDAGVDGGAVMRCPAISAGSTVALDGVDDLSKYPGTARLTPGGMIGTADEYAVTWDRDYLYVTLASPAFADGFRPLHVYLEASSGPLGIASPGQGKEYDFLTAELGFSPTHLIGVRATTAAPGGMPYNAVWVPTAGWTTQQTLLVDGTDVFASSGELSVRVAWTDLGCPTALRLTAHVVYAQPANEWKDFVPLSVTPWESHSGAHYEIDLTAAPDVTNWTDVS